MSFILFHHLQNKFGSIQLNMIKRYILYWGMFAAILCANCFLHAQMFQLPQSALEVFSPQGGGYYSESGADNPFETPKEKIKIQEVEMHSQYIRGDSTRRAAIEPRRLSQVMTLSQILSKK